MIPAGPLHQLLRGARQRYVAHLALDGLLLALAVSFGAVAVVLLAGTEMLGFYWIGIAAAAGLGLGFYLLRKQTPAEYAVAQKMDDRLKLADTLSTAAYFADASAKSAADPTVRALQQRRAEEVARTVDIPQALPLTRPRMLVPAGVLALTALGVFLFRFAVTGSFDLRESLIKNAIEALTGPPGEGAKVPKPAAPGDQAGDGEQDQREMAQNSDFAGDPSSEPDLQAQETQTDQQADGKDGQQPPEDASSPPGDPTASGDKDKQGENQDSKQNGQQNEDQSMLDKVKQALSEMLSKMKPQAGDSKGQSKKSDSSQAKQQKSESRDDSQGDSSEESGADENAANSQDDSNKSANRQSKDQQSGAGANEGDKAQRLADALKAMGKISELLGKRAENVTGSVLVEVGSTKQQMKTPTAQSAATHAEAGGEIHRDEVPPMYEQFVQQYFEQIRKTPATPAAEAAPAGTER